MCTCPGPLDGQSVIIFLVSEFTRGSSSMMQTCMPRPKYPMCMSGPNAVNEVALIFVIQHLLLQSR